MKLNIFIGLLLLNCAFVFGQTQTTETTLNPVIFQDSGALQKRAIRKNIPLTNSILKAYKAGTRDTSGRPGANYWQLKTDFSINANLNPDTQTINGSETITLHNNSPDKLDRIVLRLDHNIFRPRVPRGFSVPAETTDGMVVTRIKINGTEVDLKFAPQRQGRPGQQGPQKIEKSFVMGLDQTVATVVLAEPIDAHSTATIEIDWNTKLPGGDTGQGHRMTQRWESKLFQPTQWYPRLAKYDDLRGWDNNVYLGPSEFYNNYGKFDVKIQVPAGWIVSGTGVLQNANEALAPFVRERLASALKTDEEVMIVKEDERGVGKALLPRDKNVWHFVADEVNDFAWWLSLSNCTDLSKALRNATTTSFTRASIFSSSPVMRSLEMMFRRCLFLAIPSRVFFSMVKSNWLANRMARNMRNGSSEKVLPGSSGVLMIFFSRWSRPPKESMMRPKSASLRLTARALMVKSRRF